MASSSHFEFNLDFEADAFREYFIGVLILRWMVTTSARDDHLKSLQLSSRNT